MLCYPLFERPTAATLYRWCRCPAAADPSYDNLQEVTVRSIPPQEPHPAGSYNQGLDAGH